MIQESLDKLFEQENTRKDAKEMMTSGFILGVSVGIDAMHDNRAYAEMVKWLNEKYPVTYN